MKFLLFKYLLPKMIFRELNLIICHIKRVFFTNEISRFLIASRFFISTKNVFIQNDKFKAANFFHFILLVIILTLLKSSNSFAQVDSTDILNDKIFQYLEDATEEQEDSQLYELFDELISNPIDINNAALDDLLVLPFIPTISAKRILRFIKKVNGINTFNELKLIKKIDPNILMLIKPFVKISPRETKGKKSSNVPSLKFRSRLINDIQDKKGFIDKKYLGDKFKTYQRIKANYENFRFGALIEKDAGELSHTDFYSGYLNYKSDGIINNIILGDYLFEFGQGLAIWSPYAFSKGSDATSSINKRARGLVSYTSSDENNFFRGGASTINFGFIKLSGFYSQNIIDATLNDKSSISNFYISGYHRTENEILKKGNITSKSYGTSVSFDFAEMFNVSLMHYKTYFDKSFDSEDKFSLNGNRFSFTSTSYNFQSNNISASGEFSFNGTSVASINNFHLDINKSLTFATSVRSYPRNYYNIYSNGFGEKSSTQNELGFYAGIKWRTSLGSFNIYYDLFKQPYSSFSMDLPANGNDFLLNYKYSFGKEIVLNFKFKQETKEVDFGIEEIETIRDQTKNNYRLDLSYKLSKNIYGRNRIELVDFKQKGRLNEYGLLTFQDVKILFKNYNFIARVIFFDTESYNSRIYEFENNHRGLLTNLPMFGNGFRWYFIFNIQPIKQLKISARYSETFKPNIKSFSSGLSEIKGNVDNRFSLQFDLWF